MRLHKLIQKFVEDVHHYVDDAKREIAVESDKLFHKHPHHSEDHCAKHVLVLGSGKVSHTYNVTEDRSKATHTSHLHHKKHLNVAGVKVTHGDIERNYKYRVIRNGKVYFDDLKIHSMKRLHDDITRADKGQECGLTFEKQDKHDVGLLEGDVVECYKEIDPKEEQKFNRNPGIKYED